MSPSHLDTIRRHCLPLTPDPTDTVPDLKVLREIQAVFFDVYGTLFISASGDVGTATGERRAEAFRDALEAVGLRLLAADTERVSEAPQAASDYLIAAIGDAHQRARAQGNIYPEVDIVAIWEETLQRLRRAGLLAPAAPHIDLTDLAVEYEVRTNPTWPMPGAADCLQKLRQRDLALGIVSNAQFFTLDLFPALLGETTDALGFQPEFQFYSYKFGWAKPGRNLYQLAADALSETGIAAGNVLYIGNDMLNDIVAAQAVGFRTALFAGDARSLRQRTGDDRVVGIAPDLTVTHLSQLIDCIE